MSLNRTLDLSWDPGPRSYLAQHGPAWVATLECQHWYSLGTGWAQATRHQPFLPSGFGQNWVALGREPWLLANSPDLLLSQDVAVNPPKDFFVFCSLVLCPKLHSLFWHEEPSVHVWVQASGSIQDPLGQLNLTYHSLAFLRSS